MTRVYRGNNPSELYMDALLDLINIGDTVGPRGKSTKELRPVVFEFMNPRNRVTFLRGRVINPFFQLAEALWILHGRSDVAWLAQYNKGMEEFSDNGVDFNAPYGERLRFWNRSNARALPFGQIDQLFDVYNKIQADKETRQAVATIYNPLFDHANQVTKDRPCNLTLTFKVRNNKLDLTVFNRSNDIHWGVFGANIVQFSTIQEAMASWLGVEIGTYYQITDSLHVYLDDYGAKETDKIFKAYFEDNIPVQRTFNIRQWSSVEEPRITSNLQDFHTYLTAYFTHIDPMLSDSATYETNESWQELNSRIASCPDQYLRLTFYAMMAYKAHKNGNYDAMINALASMPDGQWKTSCLRFLSKKYGQMYEFVSLHNHMSEDIQDYIQRKGE